MAEHLVAHPVQPKYALLMANLRKEYEAGGKQIIFTEEKSQHEKIVRIIVRHLPVTKDQIGVINADTADGDKLQRISDLYNTGAFKIILANKKAEVGCNLQKGTTAIHHLTLPWTPASIQQRNGRGVRQGNNAEHINVYYYCGRGSFDAYRLDLLQKKSNWMSDLFNGADSTADNANTVNSDELLDMLEEDPEVAKARRLARLADEHAKRQVKERAMLLNMLQGLSLTVKALDSLDDAKAKERERLIRKISEAKEGLDLSTKRHKSMDGDDTERLVKAAEIIVNKRNVLTKLETDLQTLDSRYFC